MSFKAYFGEDIRRFFLSQPTLDALREKLSSVFQLSTFNITWCDEDGDNIALTTESDLEAALAAGNGGVVRLTVVSLDAPSANVPLTVAVPLNTVRTVSVVASAPSTPHDTTTLTLNADAVDRVLTQRSRSVSDQTADVASTVPAAAAAPVATLAPTVVTLNADAVERVLSRSASIAARSASIAAAPAAAAVLEKKLAPEQTTDATNFVTCEDVEGEDDEDDDSDSDVVDDDALAAVMSELLSRVLGMNMDVSEPPQPAPAPASPTTTTRAPPDVAGNTTHAKQQKKEKHCKRREGCRGGARKQCERECEQSQADSGPTPSGPVFRNIVCDACNGRVVGRRYKCIVCPDYDLCPPCEARGHHTHHTMLRVCNPSYPADTLGPFAGLLGRHRHPRFPHCARPGFVFSAPDEPTVTVDLVVEPISPEPVRRHPHDHHARHQHQRHHRHQHGQQQHGQQQLSEEEKFFRMWQREEADYREDVQDWVGSKGGHHHRGHHRGHGAPWGRGGRWASHRHDGGNTTQSDAPSTHTRSELYNQIHDEVRRLPRAAACQELVDRGVCTVPEALALSRWEAVARVVAARVAAVDAWGGRDIPAGCSTRCL